jgi:hypothetical protein
MNRIRDYLAGLTWCTGVQYLIRATRQRVTAA